VKEYDKSSQWLIQHHGDSILRLAGVDNIAAWRPLPPEQVQPRRIPDGLLEVTLRGEAEPNLYLLEIESRPHRRKVESLTDDLLLTYLARKVVPEVVALFQSEGDGTRVPPRQLLLSRRGWSRLEVSWHVVELWTVPAEELLAANDVGLIPWVPLAKFDEPPEVIVEQCRQRVEQQAPAAEKANLLTVTQFLLGLRYNDPKLLTILGGRKIMIESPVFQEAMAQGRQEMIVAVLEGRFGSVSPQVVARLRTIRDAEKLLQLAKLAGTCPSLPAFETALDF
jgi:hypothetical protein